MNKDESDTISPLGLAVISSIDEYLRRCVIPIAIADQGMTGIQGAVSLFSLGDKRYLIGAAHVFQNVPIRCLGVPLGPLPRGEQLLTLDGCKVFFSNRANDDIAVVSIDNAGIGSRLSNKWGILTENDLVGNLDEITWFVIAGFPAVTTETETGKLRANFYMALSTRYKGKVEEPVDLNNDLLLHYPKVAPSVIDKTLESTPKLQGVSGSPIWAYVPGTSTDLWSASRRLRVCGVQVSCLHSQYVRAKRWGLIPDVIESFDPATAEKIRQALSSGS